MRWRESCERGWRRTSTASSVDATVATCPLRNYLVSLRRRRPEGRRRFNFVLPAGALQALQAPFELGEVLLCGAAAGQRVVHGSPELLRHLVVLLLGRRRGTRHGIQE